MDPELQAELERLMGNAGAGADALARLTSSIQSGLPNWNAANGSVRGFGLGVQEAEKKVKSAFDRFKSGLGSAYNEIKNGFKSVGAESESGAKSIKNITDSLGSAIGGFASQFGMIGGVIGGAATAITGMTGVALGFIDELSSTNKSLAENGILLGKTFADGGAGIDEFDAIIRDTQLSASILNKTIEQSSTSLRLFSGGATNGIRTITQGFKKLREANDGQLDSLYKLGYSTEDIMSGMADFGAAARIAGQNLKMDELVDGTTKYLTLQRDLTKLTGTQVKDAKANAEALKTDIAYRRMLQEVGGKNAATLESILSNTNESLKPLVKTLLSGGQITTQQMALLEQALGPEFVNKIRGVGDQMRSGLELDPNAVLNEYKSGMKAALDSANEYIKNYSAAELQTFLNAGGPFGEFLSSFGPVVNDLDTFSESAKSAKDNASAVADSAGKIATALPAVEKASIALRSALYTVGSTLTATFAPLIGGMAGMIEGGAAKLQEGMQTYTKGINEAANILQEPVGRANSKFQTEAERSAAYAKKLGDTMSSFGEGNMFEGLFKNLGDTISSAISDGFSEAWKEVNPLVNSRRETEEYIKTDDFAEVMKKLSNVEPGEYVGNELSAYDIQYLTDYLGYLDEATRKAKMKEFKLEEKENTLFGFGTGVKELYKAPEPKAFGDIMDPKPGGHVVRVAEAGSPEIIAPASRGSDGKLGLEVSGVMLDNSRVLQNLLKVNEGQASLIAGLNSQMANMNANFEKLVYEQRQANRLAV